MDGILKNGFTCCGKSKSDPFTDEAPSLKNCLGNFFSSPWTIGAGVTGVVASATYLTGEKIAEIFVNSTVIVIAKEMGVATIPWSVMVSVGIASAGVLTGSVISYCCSKPERQGTYSLDMDSRGCLRDSTYTIGDDPDPRTDTVTVLENDPESNTRLLYF